MAVTFDAVGPSSTGFVQTSTFTSPQTWTHVVASNATALLVWFAVDAPSSQTGTVTCTAGGTSMQAYASNPVHCNGTTGDAIAYAFTLLNPPTGTITISVSFSGFVSEDALTGGSLSFIGAGSFGTPVKVENATATSITLTCTGVASTSMVGAFMQCGDTPVSPSTGTNRFQAHGLGSAGNTGANSAGATNTGSGSVSVTWSGLPSGDTNAGWAVEVIASAAAAPAFTSRQPVAPRLAALQGASAALPEARAGTGHIQSDRAKGTGNVSSAVRFGHGQGATGSPVKNPTAGPPFRQATQPCAARFVPHAPLAGTIQAELAPHTGNISGPVSGAGFGHGNGANGGPVKNPTKGPVFVQAVGPCGPRIPQNIQPTAERISSGRGAPVQNPTSGPPFRQAVQALRAKVPVPFIKGRCYSNPGAPVQNPTSGPQFRQKPQPVQFRLPPPAPRAGRIGSAPGGPVINPRRGPPVYAPLGPSAARRPLPQRGRVYASPAAALPLPPPPFFPAVQPARARLPLLPVLRGRSASNPGAPVRNPTSGPVFRQPVQALRARQPQPARGRVYATSAPVASAPVTGPPFRAATQPARARQPFPAKGRIFSSPGAPVKNPTSGPVFRQATAPAQARIPQTFSKGRTYGNPGAPVRNPVRGAAFPAAHGPVQARFPLPSRGRAASNPGTLITAPAVGPRIAQRGFPVQAKLPIPGGANTFGRAAAMVALPAPVNPTTGAAFRQATSPEQARRPLPPKGRVASSPGAPVFIAVTGPVFRQATQPARARIPQNAPRGRAAGSRGAPVHNPTAGPAFRQIPRPVQARQPFPARGRVVSGKGGIPVAQGPAIPQQGTPVQARFPLPPKGRIGSNPGIPVTAPRTGPPIPQRGQPVQAKRLPAGEPNFYGRAATMVALPAPPGAAAPFRQRTSPVRAQANPFSKGRVQSSPGAPVANPSQGPVLFLSGQPAGIRSFFLYQGRARSSFVTVRVVTLIPVLVTTGLPYTLAVTGQPDTLWEPQEPLTLWDAASPDVSWQTGVPYTTTSD